MAGRPDDAGEVGGNGPPRIGRRALLGGGLAVAGLGLAGGLELASLRGAFDHRRLEAGDGARLKRSLDATGEGDDALIHVGHSTHLLSLSGRRVLTDPWFHDPAHGGMVHAVAPAAAPGQLPALDLVLITHEHPDHADLPALDRLDKRALVVTGTRELASRVRRLGFSHVEPLAPWQRLEHAGVVVTATPAVHDVEEVGFVVERGAQRVYFAGDTALHPEMAAIGERFEPTLAVLPVDGTRLSTDRRWVMNPAEAARAATLLGARRVVPSHAEARFVDPVLALWAESVPEPGAALAALLERAAPDVEVALPSPGDRVPL